MKFNIEKNISNQLDKNEINIIIEGAPNNLEVDKIINYIEGYDRIKRYAIAGYELKNININDILYLYSDKKYNYCKTLEKEFKIKSKLYELEKMNLNFLRISKSCVINIEQVKCFDLGETGKITVRFSDGSEQIVSRRKIKDVMNYLDERRI